MIKKLLLGIFTLFFVPFLFAAAQTAVITVVDANGNPKTQFDPNESVYLEGSCPVGSGQISKVFISHDRSDWGSGVDLTDVSGGLEIVNPSSDGTFTRKEIWKAPLNEGTYDVIVDANNNFILDTFENCINSNSGFAFRVGNPAPVVVTPESTPEPEPASTLAPAPTPVPVTIETEPTPSQTFVLGDRVEVKDFSNVRSTAGGDLIDQQEKGAEGTVVGGPVRATLGITKYWFWNVNFDTDPDGWIAEHTVSKLIPAPVAPTITSDEENALSDITAQEDSESESEAAPSGTSDQQQNELAQASEPVSVNVLGGIQGAALIALAIVLSAGILGFSLSRKRD